jgi:hypothetical protein
MADCSEINNTTIIGTSAVSYDGPRLPCTNIKPCDGLDTILTKLDNVLCSAIANVETLTENVTNITEDLMIIGEDIIDINNHLNICCLTCDFTGNASHVLICEFTGEANQI